MGHWLEGIFLPKKEEELPDWKCQVKKLNFLVPQIFTLSVII